MNSYFELDFSACAWVEGQSVITAYKSVRRNSIAHKHLAISNCRCFNSWPVKVLVDMLVRHVLDINKSDGERTEFLSTITHKT